MSNAPVLLIALNPDAVSQEQLDEVQAAAPGMRLVVTHDRAKMEAVLDDIEIAAAYFPRDLLAKAPNLRWYQQWSAGSDWLMRHPELTDRKFKITTASGVHAVQITEHIIGVLLAFARRLPQALKAQGEKEWRDSRGDEVFELYGKRMLLIGVGAIGSRTAEVATALGMKVTGVRRDPSKTVPGVESMHGVGELRELLPSADFVVLTAPLTQESRGMFGEAEFNLMKRSAYLVNIGRGGTIDEAAMIRALQAETIRGAALDVFEKEPLSSDSALWEMDNVIITAHYSGTSPEYDRRAVGILLENLSRYLGKGRLSNQLIHDQ